MVRTTIATLETELELIKSTLSSQFDSIDAQFDSLKHDMADRRAQQLDLLGRFHKSLQRLDEVERSSQNMSYLINEFKKAGVKAGWWRAEPKKHDAAGPHYKRQY